jgi:hypothetical protein
MKSASPELVHLSTYVQVKRRRQHVGRENTANTVSLAIIPSARNPERLTKHVLIIMTVLTRHFVVLIVGVCPTSLSRKAGIHRVERTLQEDLYILASLWSVRLTTQIEQGFVLNLRNP